MKSPKPRFLPAILWLIVSTILLTLPGSSFPKENWLDKIWFDKWVHIGMFTLLVILWCWALFQKNLQPGKQRQIFLWLALSGLVYGAGMEFVQRYFIPNRSFDTGDILADGVGSAAGLWFSISRYIKK